MILQRQVAARRATERVEAPDGPTGGVMCSSRDGIGRARSVDDGDGLPVVRHTGDILPSGLLPIAVGTVRTDDLAAVDRDAPLFRTLRARSRVGGGCGPCEDAPV